MIPFLRKEPSQCHVLHLLHLVFLVVKTKFHGVFASNKFSPLNFIKMWCLFIVHGHPVCNWKIDFFTQNEMNIKNFWDMNCSWFCINIFFIWLTIPDNLLLFKIFICVLLYVVKIKCSPKILYPHVINVVVIFLIFYILL